MSVEVESPTTSCSAKAGNEESVVNVTKRTKDGRVLLDIEALGAVLTQEHIENLPVIVYAVAGPFRTGKSFLLNLLARYEKKKKIPCGDEENEEEELQSFFPWRGGIDHHTEGILILKDPIMVDVMMDGNAKKAAFFLMDIQGLLDHDSSSRNVSTIGIISFLMSSFQFFNVLARVDRVHIDYINKFSELARRINETDSNCNPFQSSGNQPSLMFLVRDWGMTKLYPHGMEGGQAYINKILENVASAATEHAMMREHLKETFGDIKCFLFPPPGENLINRGEDEGEKCLIKDVNPTFLSKSMELFRYVCSPEGFVIKKINGKCMTCRELFDYMQLLHKEVNSGFESDLHTFVMKQAIARMSKIQSECLESLMNALGKHIAELRVLISLIMRRKEIIDAAKKEFYENPKPSKPEMGKVWVKIRNSVCNQCLNPFKDRKTSINLQNVRVSIVDAAVKKFKHDESYDEVSVKWKRTCEDICEECFAAFDDLRKKRWEDIKKEITDDALNTLAKYPSLPNKETLMKRLKRNCEVVCDLGCEIFETQATLFNQLESVRNHIIDTSWVKFKSKESCCDELQADAWKELCEYVCDLCIDAFESLKPSDKLQSMRKTMINDTMELFDSEPMPRNENFVKKWRENCIDVCNQCCEAFQHCLRAEREYDKALQKFNTDMPKLVITSSKFRTKAKDLREKLTEELKKKIHPAIADQCCKHFENDIFKYIAATDEERRKMIKGIAIAAAVNIVLVPGLIVLSFAGAAAAVVGVAIGLRIAAGSIATIPALLSFKKVHKHIEHPKNESVEISVEEIRAESKSAGKDRRTSSESSESKSAGKDKRTSSESSESDSEEQIREKESSVLRVNLYFGEVRFPLHVRKVK